MRAGDGMRFQQFADFLVLCEQAMKTLKYMEGLNSDETLERKTSKLPSSVGVRWCCFANKMLKSEEMLFMFYDVAKFVMQAAALATDPVVSPEALKEARKSEVTSSSSSGRRDKSASSFSTNATPSEEQSPLCSSCLFCNSQHHGLENCSSFQNKTVEERKALVQEARMFQLPSLWPHVKKMSKPKVLHYESKISPKHSSEDQARVVQSA